ncbi:MAG: hypothetical protein ACE15F_12240 [bacterium]
MISATSPYNGACCAQLIYDDATPEYLVTNFAEISEGRVSFQVKFDLNNKWSNLSTVLLKLYTVVGEELLSGEFAYLDQKIQFLSGMRTGGGWDESNWNILASDSNWHKLEVRFKFHDTDGYHKVLIDDRVVYAAAGLNTNAMAGHVAASLHVGTISVLSNSVDTVYCLDEVKVSRAADGGGGVENSDPVDLQTPTPVTTPLPAVTPTNTPVPTATPTTTPTPKKAGNSKNAPLSDLVDVFDTGFESGTFRDWSEVNDRENGLKITASTAHSGRRSAKLVYQDQTPAYLIKNLDEISEGSISFWIQFTMPGGWNAVSTSLLKVYNRDGVELLSGEFAYDSGVILYSSRMRAVNNWDESGWSTLAADGRWHRIEVQFKMHPSDGYHRVLIDNTVVHASTGLMTDVFPGQYVNAMHLGASANLQTGVNGTLYLDDVSVGDREADHLSLVQLEMPPLDFAEPTPPDTPVAVSSTMSNRVTSLPRMLDLESPIYLSFESGDFSEWTDEVDPGQDLNVSALVSHGGSKSAMFSCDDLTPEYLVQNLGNAREGKISLWFKFDRSGPWSAVSTPLLTLFNSKGIEIYSGGCKMEDGAIKYRSRFRMPGSWDESGWAVLAADDEWHKLEVQYKIHATEGWHHVKIDGVLVHQSDGLDSDVFPGVFAGEMRLGDSLSLRAGMDANYFVDEVLIEKL